MGVDTVNQIHNAITDYNKITDVALAGEFWDKTNMADLKERGLLYEG